MLFPMKAIGERKLSPEDLKSDRKNCIHYEETGLGKKALLLPFMGIGRRAYIPLSSLERVYKRLCVSKGFFEEGKIYGPLSYLVMTLMVGRRHSASCGKRIWMLFWMRSG